MKDCRLKKELVKELTLSDKVLEQIVAQDGGTVVDASDSALPSSPTGEVRLAEETKTLQEEPKELIVSFPDFLQDSVVPLLKYLYGKREKYAVSKEVGFYVEMIRNRTQLKRALAVKRDWDSAIELARERAANLATECAAVKRLITTAEKREKEHIEELATLEARRAEEVRIAEELRGKIAEAKTAEEDLRRKVSAI
ncbi:hypothetical protein AXG93_2775s1000 [Marchantia polymorpha subsp. ruderalis]|uniref:Uncharacterized protein n=1 Tax=Marchantia polymorpha subsp. ruderalis TaxID=1480154 RepID=A0A176VNQ1_MARPO|nr:hypothetical protein AXG93_2775s1000 [Marchantia polymorpha subsp. ruderalis]